MSDKKRLPLLLLCIFLGTFGFHRFYAGKIGTGILWFFTIGILGLGWLYDMILILCGVFEDREGKKIVAWT